MADFGQFSDAGVKHKRYSVFAGQRAVAIYNPGGAMPPLVVGGRYQLVQRLGWGGMATVWRAVQQSPRRTVALKLLTTSAATDRLRARFDR